MRCYCSAIALSASLLLLAGCSDPFFQTAPETPASAQTLSPVENLQMARKLAWEAAVVGRNPPHSAATWKDAKVKWRQAIRLLATIPENTAVSGEAKRKLAEYQVKYNAISQRLQDEETASADFQQAQTAAWQAAVTVQNPPHPVKIWQRSSLKWEQAAQLMAQIPPLTTTFDQAQQKAKIYRSNTAAIEQQIAAEELFLSTVKNFSTVATRLNTLQIRAVTEQESPPIGIDYAAYKALVQTLEDELKQLESFPSVQVHPAYAEMSEALSDYQFALTVWQTYLRHKQANADWLQNGDFFNQLIPLSLIDRDRLLKRYDVKLHYGLREAKVPLKFALWAIWEQADQEVHSAKQKTISVQ